MKKNGLFRSFTSAPPQEAAVTEAEFRGLTLSPERHAALQCTVQQARSDLMTMGAASEPVGVRH